MLQTIIFDKSMWDVESAKEWLRKHNYKDEQDETETSIHFRQLEPNFEEYYTYSIPDKGINFVSGKGILDVIKSIGKAVLPAIGDIGKTVLKDTAKDATKSIISNIAQKQKISADNKSRAEILSLLEKATDPKERIELIKLLK